MEDLRFKGKIILFLSVRFFNYENIIADKLRSLGSIVYYFDERPNNSILFKGLIRLNRNIYKRKIIKYYNNILIEIKTRKLDYFFLIKGEVIPQFFIDRLKKIFPNIVLIYYTFDSFLNNPNAKEIIHKFDHKFTFDRKDSILFKLNFRPLFFSDDYGDIEKKEKTTELDLLFIGTAHSDRYLISEKLMEWCQLNNLKSFSYYYSSSRLSFWFFKLFDSDFSTFKYSKVTFKSLKHSEIINLYGRTKVILDIHHPKQVGLTMRTFESLGAEKKIITTNYDIINYPFYNSNNIWIIDRNNITVDLDFFTNSFNKLDPKLVHSMSITGWLEELFFDHEKRIWI
jgi:hypothetical protein